MWPKSGQKVAKKSPQAEAGGRRNEPQRVCCAAHPLYGYSEPRIIDRATSFKLPTNPIRDRSHAKVDSKMWAGWKQAESDSIDTAARARSCTKSDFSHAVTETEVKAPNTTHKGGDAERHKNGFQPKKAKKCGHLQSDDGLPVHTATSMPILPVRIECHHRFHAVCSLNPLWPHSSRGNEWTWPNRVATQKVG